MIRDAILREVSRGGQVYFLYNSVQTIGAFYERLKQLVPEAHIGVAHGQMREHGLEDVMMDFYGGSYDVLLCTTIIESGLDVPTANTLIVFDADRFGLSQLYQLRGRVGRSNLSGVCVLHHPPGTQLVRDGGKAAGSHQGVHGVRRWLPYRHARSRNPRRGQYSGPGTARAFGRPSATTCTAS